MSRKYTVASRRIAAKRFGRPGNFLVFDLTTVTKMIKNVRRSMIPQCGVREVKCIRTPEVGVCQKSGGKGVPKATEILVKASSPARQLAGTQTLNASKFIAGNGGTSS